jgi:hypothetical protein
MGRKRKFWEDEDGYIVVDEGDEYCTRAKRLDMDESSPFFGSAFSFVVVEWEHPNFGYFADGMFWWRSMHNSEWTPVSVATWCHKYESVEQFLNNFPEFEELFGEEGCGLDLMGALKRIADE